MKKALLTFIFGSSILLAFGQELEEKITKLKAPSSPASVIIGIQPATISKPKSWEALEAGLFTNYYNQSSGLTIPNDYALEFTPYWMRKDVYVPMSDFATPSIGKSLQQNLSFSIASTKNFIIHDTVHRDAIGFGARTMLWQGSKKEVKKVNDGIELARQKLALKNLVTQATLGLTTTTKADYISKVISALKKNSRKLMSTAPLLFASGSVSKWLNTLSDRLEAELGTDASTYDSTLGSIVNSLTAIETDAVALENMIKDRKGLKVEVATALAVVFPTNETDFSYLPTYSVWVTPSYQPFNQEHWEFVGVLRFNWLDRNFYTKYTSKQDIIDRNTDYGLRLVYKLGRFSVEAEGVGRRSKVVVEKTTDPDTGLTTEVSRSDKDFQYILNFNYRISESIIVSYNFGKQFKPVLTSNQTLINMLTLNLGLGGPRKDDLAR
jgi:Putative MetA-pathway of phenol degradation